MPDRDKVISHFQDAIEASGKGNRWRFVRVDIIEDAIELLKEQEPKVVKIKKNAYNHEFYYCPRCDRGFEDFFRKPMFCDKCGQAVKWDG